MLLLVLEDVHFDIPAGKTVAVVGPTGSGKSTLVTLLARLWDPDSGVVHLDGRDLRDFARSALPGEVAFVGQDVFLFDDTVTGNIAFGIDVPRVGDMASIEGGLPSFHIPTVPLTLETFEIILPYALILAAIGLIESLLTLNLVGDITGQRGGASQECIAQGAANTVTGFFGGMGGCAMIGQSMINVKSGGRTRIAGIAAALLPDVAATLRGLYGASVAGTLSIRPVWWGRTISPLTIGRGWKAATPPTTIEGRKNGVAVSVEDEAASNSLKDRRIFPLRSPSRARAGR